MFSRRAQPAVALLTLISVTACTAWQPVRVAPAGTALPERVRLTLQTGEQVTLWDATLQGDTTVVGREGRDGPVRQYPLGSVRELEARSRVIGRTILLGVGIVVVGLGLVYLGFWAACAGGWGPCD
jgi:hypothetical protein